MTNRKSYGEGDKWEGDGDQVFSACERQQKQDKEECDGRFGCYKTKCEEDGTFSPRQSLGSACWCVDNLGNKYDESTDSCGNFTTDCTVLREQSACQTRRQQDIANCGSRPYCYSTQCDLEGGYSQKQINQTRCWCVDSKGNEINGSRTNPCDSYTECLFEEEDDKTEIMLGHHKMNHEALKELACRGLMYMVASIFFAGPILGGFYLAVFNAIKNNSTIRFRDFFGCFCCKYYCKLLGLSLVLRVLQAVLYLLLILPGVWWSLATMFAIPVHKEHPFLGVCGSIRISMLVVHRHFCRMICFLLLLALMQIGGFLCLIVGLLYTIPLGFVALCYCYHDLIGIVPVVPVAVPVDTPVTMHM